MHIVETYATNCGLKIDKPSVVDKFYPLTMDKFITFHPFSKPAKSYDYWQTVIDIIHPVLKENDIEILQLGGANEQPFLNCSHAQGSTSVNQVAYIMKRSMLHVGADSFPIHIASSMKKKIVGVYPYCNIENVGPYFSEEEQCSLLVGSPPEEGSRPFYSFQEHPKSINSIKPEEIAKAICSHLDLELDFPYETIRVGKAFQFKTVENVPNQIIDIKTMNIDSVIMRMDLLFNEHTLMGQLSRCPCTIVSDRPVKIEILKQFKEQIREFVYLIKENDEPEFAKTLESLGLKYSLLSELLPEEVRPKKLDYIDLERAAILNTKLLDKESIEEIKDVDINKLYYKSSCVLLSDNKAYTSEADWIADAPVTFYDEIRAVTDTPRFWKHAEKYMLMKEID